MTDKILREQIAQQIEAWCAANVEAISWSCYAGDCTCEDAAAIVRGQK